MRTVPPRRRPSGVKGVLLMIGALIVLLTYPLGVIWILLTTQDTGVSMPRRLWYALGWPLITFISMMDEASKRLPHAIN
ncbi:MAG TPA: hypothetical protein VJM32_06420 [Candidatus Saccharimonadales bacterium]|nr:hypothetical protein [Candidatus Saccharimonadales bacterium]